MDRHTLSVILFPAAVSFMSTFREESHSFTELEQVRFIHRSRSPLEACIVTESILWTEKTACRLRNKPSTDCANH